MMVFLAPSFADPFAAVAGVVWLCFTRQRARSSAASLVVEQQSLHPEPPTHVFTTFFRILSVRQCTTISVP
jgi:hypothetical protein